MLERMDEKLDEILAGLRSLKRRVRSIENQNVNNISMNKKLTKVSKIFMILYICYIHTNFLYILDNSKNVAKKLILNNIYPKEEEFHDATEDYVSNNHPEFYEDLNESWWKLFYDDYIYSSVSLKYFILIN
jgi:hypothetical protein